MICSGGQPAAPTFDTVSRGEVSTGVTASGALAARSSEQLGFAQGGRLTSVKVKVGDKVQKGDVLATIDDLRTDATHIAARTHSMQSPAHTEASARLAALGARTSAAREALGHNEWPPQTGAVEHRAQTPRLTTELATALGHTTGPLADPSPSHTSTRARTQQAPPQHERYER